MKTFDTLSLHATRLISATLAILALLHPAMVSGADDNGNHRLSARSTHSTILGADDNGNRHLVFPPA